MSSGDPTSLNLLQAFVGEEVFADKSIHFSASRVSKVTPTQPLVRELLRSVQSGPRRLFRMGTPLMWRVRYTRWHTSLHENSIITTIDIESPQNPGYTVAIKDVNLSLVRGRVEPLYKDQLDKCKPGDLWTLLFKLQPSKHESFDATQIHEDKDHLSLIITADILVSEECTASVKIEWHTDFDFNAGRPNEAKRIPQRPNAQQPGSSSQHGANPSIPKTANPDSLPQSDGAVSRNDAELADMSVSISAAREVHVGDMFQWRVFVLNRSQQARKLAVLAIPRRVKSDVRKHAKQSSVSSIKGKSAGSIAEAIIDDNIVYAKQKNARLEPAEMVNLSTDVRVGYVPLPISYGFY